MRKLKLWELITTGLILMMTIGAGCFLTGNSPDYTGQDRELLEAGWESVQSQAQGQVVNINMWGGSDSINRYIDEWVAPRLAAEASITLRRVPVSDIKDVINKLLVEKQVGKQQGSVDLIWINGENFKMAKDNHLLWGPFVGNLPNYQLYVDGDAPDITNDFGLETAGLEAPWGRVQFVFVHDAAKVQAPPRSMQALKEWVRQNPGKFAYPAPPDFTGSAFIRHALYELTGGYQQYMQTLDAGEIAPKLAPLWNYLNEIEPYLWRQGTTYPESLAKLDQLYASGEVWMTMGYDAGRAASEVKKGFFPTSTRTFVLEAGTLANTHFLAIPINAAQKAGAMLVIDYLLSPAAQLAKYDPVLWGEDMVLDAGKLTLADRQYLDTIDRGEASLPATELDRYRLPEIPAEYVDFLEQGWSEHVARQ